MLITTLCSLLFPVAALIPTDRERPREILQPFSAVSPSGAWRLEVEPSDRFGIGEGTHRVLQGDVVVHTTRLPYTLRVAAITDRGFAVGIRDPSSSTEPGQSVVSVLGPEGQMVRESILDPLTPRGYPRKQSLLVDATHAWVHALGGIYYSGVDEAWWRIPIESDEEPTLVKTAPPRGLTAAGTGLGRNDHRRALDPDTISSLELVPRPPLSLLDGRDGGPTPHPLLDLINFGFGPDGTPVAIRRGRDGKLSSIWFAPDGTHYKEAYWDPLPSGFEGEDWDSRWIGGTRWILSERTARADSGQSRWFLADAKRPDLVDVRPPDRLREGQSWSLDSAAGTNDGDFALLISARPSKLRRSLRTKLVSYDSGGSLRWELERTASPVFIERANIAVSIDGTIAVLDPRPADLRLFSDTGRWLLTIDLAADIGGFLVGVHAAPTGGFWIEEYEHREVAFWPVSEAGKIGSPTAGGTRYGRIGPDGSSWASRRRVTVFQSGEDKASARVFGHAPDDPMFIDPNGVQVDVLGRSWICDRLSDGLSCFSAAGSHESTLRMASDGNRWLDGELSNRPDGGVLIAPRLLEQSAYRWSRSDPWKASKRFDAGGRGLADTPQVDGVISLELPGSLFVISHPVDPLRIVDAQGETVESFDRLPNGRWSGPIHDAVWTADGRGALLGDDLILLDSHGRPKRAVRPPVPIGSFQSAQLSMNGDRALIADQMGLNITMYTLSEDRWERMTLSGSDAAPDPGQHAGPNADHGYALGLSPDGETILAVDRRTYSLRRYPLE